MNCKQLLVVCMLLASCKSGGQVGETAEPGEDRDGAGVVSDTSYLWSTSMSSSAMDMVVAAGDLAVVVDASGLKAVALSDGSERWRLETCSLLLGRPVLQEDMVLVVCEDDDTFRALRAENGKPLWSVPMHGPARSLQTDGKTVWVAGPEGEVMAIDATNGQPRWKMEMEGWRCQLLLHDDTLLVGSDEGVRALDSASGAEKWKSQPAEDGIYGMIVHGETLVYDDGVLRGLELATGLDAWKSAEGLTLLGVGDGKLYVARNREVLELDSTTGETTRSLSLGNDWASPVFGGSMLYFTEYKKPEHLVIAHDLKKGEQAWQYRFPRETGLLTLADGILLVPCDDGNLYALSTEPRAGTSGGRLGQVSLVADVLLYSAVHYGYGNNEIVAVDAGSGQELWAREVGWQMSSPAAVDGTTAYYGTTDLELVAMDVTSGEPLWAADMTELSESKWIEALLVAPVVAGGVVYFACGDMMAHDASTGELLWTDEYGDTAFPPVVAAGNVHIIDKMSYYIAFDQDTGEKLWSYRESDFAEAGSGPPLYSALAITEDTAYYSTDRGDLFGLDPATGEEKWRDHVSGGDHLVPHVYDGKLLISNDYEDYLQLLDAGTRTVLWTYEVGAIPCESPAVRGERAFLFDTDNRLHAIDMATGEALWVIAPGIAWKTVQIVAGELLYVTFATDELVALDPETGETVWGTGPIPSS